MPLFHKEFHPSLLSPFVWCDARELPLFDGVPVTSFADESGNGSNFIQLDGTKKTTFAQTLINGLPAVVGDGVASYMPGGLMPTLPNWWALIVCQAAALVGPTQILVTFEDTAGAGPEQSGLWIVNPGSGPMLQWTQTGAGRANVLTTIPFAAGTPYAFLLQDSPENGNITNNLGQSFDTGVNASSIANSMALFARGGGPWFPGGIGLFGVGTGALTSAQVAALWAWVKKEWKF